MPSLFLFLIKINAVLLLFAIAYFLVLRRLTFYTINRYFLLIGIVFSSLYPFIDLTTLFASQTKFSLDLVPAIYTNDAINNIANPIYWNILSLVFYIGMALLLVRFLIQLISLFRVHKNSYPGHINHYPIRILKEKINPFSFWNTIYINPEIHAPSDLRTILTHEKIHVRQYHTIDIILSELSVIIYWFNPGVWFMKKAIKENIEFITDAAVLKQRIDKKAYQYDLLKVEVGHSALALVNTFNISGLQKRIQMMNVKRSSPFKKISYFILLPMMILFALAFTISKKEILAKRILNNSITQSVGRLPSDIYDVPLNNTNSDADFKVVASTLISVVREKKMKNVNTKKTVSEGPFLVSSKLTKAEEFDSKNVKVVSVRKFSFSSSSKDTVPVIINGVGKLKGYIEGLSLAKEGSDQKMYNLKRKNLQVDISISSNDIKSEGSVSDRKFFINGKEISESQLAELVKPNEIEEIKFERTDSTKNLFIKIK